MPDQSESRWGETTGPLIRGWDMEQVGSSAPFVSDSTPETMAPFLDLSFHLAEPGQEVPRTNGSIAMTRTMGASCLGFQTVLHFPSRGETIGGFRVVSELGRGAFARVYLAEQVDLAGRLVALKVAEALGDEPQALARLQHTHIVPIHSVHDDPRSGLRLLCMPYVGGANLAQVLERSGAHLPSQTSGRSLVEALDLVGGRAPTRVTSSQISGGSGTFGSLGGAASRGLGTPTAVRSMLGRYWVKMPWWKSLTGGIDFSSTTIAASEKPDDRDQPARRYLRSHTYVQAACWITARLAEGLEHAHARGILHRDLKPSNILIAADGTPMLLDFNLAVDTPTGEAHETGDRAMLGGTLPYMAPEHLDAFNPMGSTDARAVDQRSDIYALGLILFEMIAGRHPFADPTPGLPILQVVALMTKERLAGAPSARSINSAVPRSLDAIIAKCLNPLPDCRYGRASELAEDLQRFLDDLPNLHAPEPSLPERAGKWYRRHPEVRGAGPVAATAAVFLLMLGVTAWSISDYAEGARAKLKRNTFHNEFENCQLLLNTSSGPASHRSDGVAKAEKLLGLYEVVKNSKWLQRPSVTRLSSNEQFLLREEISELLLLLARARIAQVSGNPEPQRRTVLEAAVVLLGLAIDSDPRPSAALFESRSRIFGALGDSERANADRRKAENLPPRSSRDFYLRGTNRAADQRYDLAELDLAHAISLDPKRFWAWFVLGICHHETARFSDAVGDFSACTLLAPEFAWPHLNRGLALSASGRLSEARFAYDRALALSPDFVEALVDRAVTCLELNDAAQAERDLARAIQLGRNDSLTLAAHAEALNRTGHPEKAELEFADALKVRPNDPRLLSARGMSRIATNPNGSVADFQKALERDPRNMRAHYGLALVLRKSKPEEALDHINRALDAEPSSMDGFQVRAVLLGRMGNPAAVADAERLARKPSAQNLYNAACSLALLDSATGKSDHVGFAREYLKRAIDLGFPVKTAESDPDLKSLYLRILEK